MDKSVLSNTISNLNIDRICISDDELFHDCINEASNFNVKIPKNVDYYFKNLSINDRKMQLFKRSDYDVKSNYIKNNEIESEKVASKLIDTEQDIINQENSFGSKKTIHYSDISKLKNRQWSSYSICSTSSSSSSTSEKLPETTGISCMANIKSIADQNKNEYLNNNYTLCERACMEIIDSERIYVDDLRQIIKGYV